MATNDFLVFGGGSSPNVIDQATYAALAARLSGFQSGTALSAQLNKVWRQSSIMAAVLAQFTANFSGQNSVDDGTIATLLANLQAAINAAGITAPQFDSSARLATTAFVQRALGNYQTSVGKAGTYTCTGADCGTYFTWDGNGTFTLPNSSGLPAGASIAVFKFGTNSGTFAVQGADNFNWNGAGGTSISVGSVTGFVVFVKEAGAVWDAAYGDLQLLKSSVMSGANFTTAPQFDSSTKLATTAFVQRAGGNFQTRKYVIGSGTLALSDTGSWIQAGGTGPSTITLPAPTTINLTYTITNVTNNSTSVTIATPSANIYNQAMGAPTFLADVGATVELVSDGSNWTIVSHYTRSPIAQTPAQYDNSTKLATTAFVLRALGGFSGFLGINASTTLNSSVSGQAVQSFASASITVTLPPSSTMPVGNCITFFNNGSSGSVMNVATQGSDSITTPGANVTNVPLQLGDTLQVMSRGSAEWDIVGGTAGLQFAASRGMTPAAGDNSTKLATTAFVMNGLYSGKGIARFVSSGTFTVPAGVTTIYVSGCAGGGGGGAGAGNNNGQSSLVGGGGGGGGGAGQSVLKQSFSVTSGATITVTIGAAGTAGTGGVVGAGGAGGAGGNTTLTGGASLVLTGGAGGGGGSAVVSNVAGQGGAGGGGGAGYPNGSAGGDGNYAGLGGAGASSLFGGGGGSGRASTITNPSQTGSAAGGYGGGGGGGGAGYGQASTAVTGGAGAVGTAGLIVFEW
ncbi:hypothetical protein [Burkholderia cepacia]|uniref:glycine-rich domain-containing protein n=1 Tax=Burkholderia cepacia TaxID=292 RepID=UPI000B0E3F7B|nr:hypothetical protein [Burkholderia cepacia]